LTIRLQPRASRDEIIGIQGDHLKVRVTAPPVEGQANAQLIRFLASTFKVSKSGVRLLAGEKGREKIVKIMAPRCLPPPIVEPFDVF